MNKFSASDPKIAALLKDIDTAKRRQDFLYLINRLGVVSVQGYDVLSHSAYVILDVDYVNQPVYNPRYGGGNRLKKMISLGSVLIDPDILGVYGPNEDGEEEWRVMDGVGRTALYNFKGHKFIACKVKLSSNMEEEAASCYKYNTGVTRMSPKDVLWAMLKAKDPDAMAMVDVCHEFGFDVPTDHMDKGKQHADMQNIGVLRRAYDNKVQRQFLSILAEWKVSDGSLMPTAKNNAEKLQSVLCTFCVQNKKDVDRLRKVIKNNKIVPETIFLAARKFDASHRLTMRSLRRGLVHVIKKAKGGFTIE